MFSNAVKVFSLNTFDIKVDPSWLLIAALITWSLSRQYFPTALPGMDHSVYLVMAILAMLGFFASLLLHELAHSIVARRFGVPIESITLFLFGGVAELGAEPPSAKVEFWIAVAGPAMSLFLTAWFWVLEYLTVWSGGAQPLVAVLSYLAVINLVLALFNLLPAFPLDGGRVLRAVLWHRSGDLLSATETASRSGAILAYFLMGLGVVALFQGLVVAGLWHLMIGAFILIAARASYAQQVSKLAFDGRTVSTLMSTNPVTVNPDMALSEFVNRIMLPKHITFAPVTEGEVLLGHIDASVLSRIDRENWANTRVGDVFIGLEPDYMVGPDVPVSELFEIISKTGHRKFLVVSDHTLLGVVSLSDLTRVLQQVSQLQQLHTKSI